MHNYESAHARNRSPTICNYLFPWIRTQLPFYSIFSDWSGNTLDRSSGSASERNTVPVSLHPHSSNAQVSPSRSEQALQFHPTVRFRVSPSEDDDAAARLLAESGVTPNERPEAPLFGCISVDSQQRAMRILGSCKVRSRCFGKFNLFVFRHTHTHIVYLRNLLGKVKRGYIVTLAEDMNVRTGGLLLSKEAIIIWITVILKTGDKRWPCV